MNNNKLIINTGMYVPSQFSNKPVINLGIGLPVRFIDDNNQVWCSPNGIKYVRKRKSDGNWGEWIRLED